MVETTNVEITAMLNPVRDAATVNYYVGDDDTAELMGGYLVAPLSLPVNLHPPIEGQALVETSVGVTRTGTFKLLPASGNPYLIGVGIDFLNRVNGVFRRG